ncbi:MAG: Hsp20/alpha crystallin family protein [Spirochaetaceae bacterium]|nr:Hsp20/alpha crystallin family protein [Spirochaetaceae bacterium]
MNSLAFFNPRFTSDLFDVIDRNLADFVPSQAAPQVISPKVDVRETPAAYILDMDLPGLTEKDVEINLKDRVLSISSKMEEKKEEKKDGEWLIKERRSSCFSRRFTLPQDIDAEKVTAEFKHGVLSVDIPRKPEPQAKQIAITVK